MQRTPFTHRFSTNYAPTDDELKHISQLLVEPRNQLSRLDTEISRLQRSFDELSAKRNQLSDFITLHQALLSPIRRIPQEILQEIFVRCLLSDHNSVMSCREAPLLLGRVCSSWRSISRSTPILWSSIHIAVPDLDWAWEAQRGTVPYGHKHAGLLIQAVIDWLNRSASLPLSISLYHGRPVPEEFTLMQHLISLSDRWRDVDLTLSTTTYPLLSSLTKECVPLLESFSFRTGCISQDYFNRSTYSLDVFYASRLQRLLIPHFMASPSLHRLGLTEIIVMDPWGLGGLPIDAALDILLHCENLATCRMTILSHASGGLINGYPVSAPSLKTLAITGGNGLQTFFDRLQHFPALHSFEIDVTIRVGLDVGDYNNSPLCAFLGRLTALECFTFTSPCHTREALVECITHIPDIKQLSLKTYMAVDDTWGMPTPNAHSNTPLDDQVLVHMTAAADRMPLPHLKVIECEPAVVSDEALLSFILSRTTLSSTFGVTQLERAKSRVPRVREKDIFPALSQIILVGTEVVITYQEPLHGDDGESVQPWRGVYRSPRLRMA